MKRLLTGFLAGLLVCAVVAPTLAWEFDLKGVYENRLRYFGRMGNDDLFGKANFQDAGLGTFVGFAGPNIYGTGNVAPVVADFGGGLSLPRQVPSVVITRGGFSRWGSDAFYNDNRMVFEPVLRINPAVRLRGTYAIGGMRNKYRQTGANEMGAGIGTAPLERYYMSQSSMNASDGVFATWEQFDFVAQTPWAIIVGGFRDFPWGVGATFGRDTRNDTLLFIVPYGPFKFLWGAWLSRGGYMESWQTVPDACTKPSFFEGVFAAYDSGCLNVGVGVILRIDRFGAGAVPNGNGLSRKSFPYYSAGIGQTVNSSIPDLLNGGINTVNNLNPGATELGPQATINRQTFFAMAHAKYFNGRFFANVEFAWIDACHQFDANVPASGQQGVPTGGSPLYIEGYHWFSELGAVTGPAKVSLLYAQVSGLVLNNGWGPSNAGLPVKLYTAYPIDPQAMEPYEFLMFNTYGGGNNGGWFALNLNFMSDERGKMADAYAFAGRIDYAVAANLNIWASYLWAHRLERAGFFTGGVRDVSDGNVGTGAGVAPGTFLAAYGGTTPYVPDGYIGWEGGIGVDWKLLESFNLKLRYAYWQPGDWFDYAYQAFVPLGPYAGPVGQLGAVGVLKGRSPINAFEGKFVIEF